MSDSPQSNPKDVEQGAPSGDDEGQMNDPQDPHSTGLGYEFEVKEQDRWLPIANGMSCFLFFDASLVLPPGHDSRACVVVALSPRRLRSACMATKPSLTGAVPALPTRQPRVCRRSRLLCQCRASRRPTRRKRPAAPRRPPRPSRTMSTMLTFATLHQWPGS